jgi:2-oxoglutarate ferredoxin oxidoreductase subunit delta
MTDNSKGEMFISSTPKEERMPVKGRVTVSEVYCKGCELCVGACPQEALRLDAGRITVKGYHPAATSNDRCTGCGVCALVCPEAAITVYREALRQRRPDLQLQAA